jgi:hypothetical protein
MRFEVKDGERKGNWYEIEVAPCPGPTEKYYLFIGFGPMNMILEEKRPVMESSWDEIIEEIEKLQKRIEAAGYVRVETNTY